MKRKKKGRIAAEKTCQASFSVERSLASFFCNVELTWKEPMDLLLALKEVPRMSKLKILQKKTH
jgi:hypothetical protein